jgi:hypothetical protein
MAQLDLRKCLRFSPSSCAAPTEHVLLESRSDKIVTFCLSCCLFVLIEKKKGILNDGMKYKKIFGKKQKRKRKEWGLFKMIAHRGCEVWCIKKYIDNAKWTNNK